MPPLSAAMQNVVTGQDTDVNVPVRASTKARLPQLPLRRVIASPASSTARQNPAVGQEIATRPLPRSLATTCQSPRAPADREVDDRMFPALSTA